MKKALFLTLLVFNCIFLVPAHAEQSDASLQTILDQLVTDYKFIGAVALVQTPSGTVYTAASGLANTDSNTPMSADMHFRVASLSKFFTAVVCLRLQEEGVLDLDDALTTWFPNATIPYADTITLRDLISMRAGIDDIPASLAIQFMLPPQTQEWTWTLAETSTTTTAAPGSTYSYINRNFILADLICAQAAGKTYRELLDEYVLTPLGLADSSIPTDTNIPTPYANLYAYYDSMGQPSSTQSDLTNVQRGSYGFGAFGMVSTASDLITFVDGVFDQGLLSASSLAEMQDFLATDGTDFYGLGLKKMGDCIGHDGSFLEGHTAVAIQVNGYEVAILTNGTTENNGASARTLMDPLVTQFELNTGANIVPTILAPTLLND